jgi:hypothetical protein
MLIHNKGSNTFEWCWPVCVSTLYLWFKALCVSTYDQLWYCVLLLLNILALFCANKSRNNLGGERKYLKFVHCNRTWCYIFCVLLKTVYIGLIFFVLLDMKIDYCWWLLHNFHSEVLSLPTQVTWRTMFPVFWTRWGHAGSVVDELSVGQVFSEYFSFLFHQLLHIC